LGEDIVHALWKHKGNMRETVWSLSTVDVRKLRGLNPSTRGPGRVDLWCIGCCDNSSAE